MSVSFLPNLILPALTDLTAELLKEKGIRFLMLDFDNTIVPYTRDEPTDAVEAWFAAMKDSGITLCMVSNSKRERVKRFCDQRGIPCIRRAKKPFWWVGIRSALRQFGVPAGESAIVGDQIFTDTLGGNGAGVMTVLVTPIHNHNIWLKLRHVAEQPFIYLAKRRISNEKH